MIDSYAVIPAQAGIQRVVLWQTLATPENPRLGLSACAGMTFNTRFGI